MTSFSRCSILAGVIGLASIGCTAGSNGAGGGGAGSGTQANTTSGFTEATTGGTFSSGTQATNGSGGGCAGTSIQAQKAQLDLFIMLDQSGSMSEDGGNGKTKWVAVTDALKTFVDLPQANGLGVGINYFGLSNGPMCPTTCFTNNDCGACGPCVGAQPMFNFPGFCTGSDSCKWSDYAGAEVEIAPLPGSAAAIKSSIASHSPSTGTPTHPALQGAINHAKGWANAHPGHVTVVVLATDGVPSGCDEDINHIADIAELGFTVNPSIRTFVIGVGSSLSSLNAIAAAGGTTSAFIVDTSSNTTQQFLDALNVIQGIVLPCSYGIPVPPVGEPDFKSVNVNYTPGGGSKGVIPFVANEAACPATGNAWYYDDPANPTQILLCPSTCQTVSADTMGTVDIVLGCATIPA